MPTTVPNQFTLKIKKEKCDDKSPENYYSKINLNAMQDAALDLKGETFKL